MLTALLFFVLQPNREDEYARIEAEGGKVIQWNGYRVFGVLAMSRSIGMPFITLQHTALLYNKSPWFTVHAMIWIGKFE